MTVSNWTKPWLTSATRHELEFNKGWIRENPDLALKFSHKFHTEYNEKYKISITDEKYWITYVADLRTELEKVKNDDGI